MDMQQLLDRAECTIEYQKQEIDRLRSEVARLTAGADAHTTLQSIYRDPDASQSLRAKAAAAALPVERPRLLSVVSSTEPNRTERWRAYARYRLKEEIILETGQPPALGSGWDAHLRDGVYVPPDGDAEPPLDLYGKDAIAASHRISNMARVARRNGNADDTDNTDD